MNWKTKNLTMSSSCRLFEIDKHWVPEPGEELARTYFRLSYCGRKVGDFKTEDRAKKAAITLKENIQKLTL